MALKRLTTAEMVQISGPWTTNGSAAREAIQSIPELAGILPRIDAAQKQLHAARPVPDDPRAAGLAREAAEIDARHDAVVRGVDRVLEGLLLLAGDTARARAIEAARSLPTASRSSRRPTETRPAPPRSSRRASTARRASRPCSHRSRSTTR